MAEPLANAGNSAVAMAIAGRSLQDFVGATAGVVGILVAVATLLLALIFWITRGCRGCGRRAPTAVHNDPEGLDVLALRALANAPIEQLTVTGDGLLSAWRSGDPAVIRTLAQLEMSRLGLFLPVRSDVR